MPTEPVLECVALVGGWIGHIKHATGFLVVAIVYPHIERIGVAFKAQTRG